MKKLKTLSAVFAAVVASLNIANAADEPVSYKTEDSKAPMVFFTKDITAKGLVNIYDKLEFTPEGKVGVKISTGEPPRSNYLRPELIKDLVQKVHGDIIECNTAYHGSRFETKVHYAVAKEHGYTDIAKVVIMDEDGETPLPVPNYKNMKEFVVGSKLLDYQTYIVLSHFKGHQMAGYGGALKNVSIGMGSSHGKEIIHLGGKLKGDIFNSPQIPFLEAMAEANLAFTTYVKQENKKVIYINVLNRISIDCDCNGNPAEPNIHDIGIVAGYDPVAVDQAALDLVKVAEGNEALMARIAKQQGIHTTEYSAQIGVGVRNYRLTDID